HEHDRNRETRLSHKPHPPFGMGPLLAWHKASRCSKLVLFLGSAALLLAGFALLSTIQGYGLDMLTAWPVWTVVIIGAWLMTAPFTYTVLSAGADWLQLDKFRFGIHTKSGFVKLYELREVHVMTGGVAFYLELADDTWSIDRALHEWQHDRRLWDLVYNGILHSVAAGAEVDRNARGLLELDHVPELRYPEGVRDIDVTKLSDDQVRQLMKDKKMRSVLDVIEFEGGPDEFRKLHPTLPEDLLDGPADPAWFAGHQAANEENTTDADDPWMRFYRGRH
ncbi:MAG: hypothetical protein ACRDSE_10135, partial [Pseudonocardiaceae bacterium]